MELYIRSAEPGYSDDLVRLGNELYELDAVDMVRTLVGRPERDRLNGGLVEVLVVALGAGGSITMMVKALVGLLKKRPGLRVKVSVGQSGKVVSVDVPRGTRMPELADFIDRIVEQLEKPELPEKPGDDHA